MLILPFDTETTGIPDWKSPSNAVEQPHILELGAILVDDENRQIKDSMDVLVRPDNWEVPAEITELTGITREEAMDTGIPEDEALDRWLALYDQAELRIAHNTTFDNRIIRIALKRYRPDRIPDNVWKNKESYFCTMIAARKITGGKQPTLSEAYEHFYGKPLENAHRAMEDCQACLEVYWSVR